MAHQITLIPGDGIGPEVAEATVRAVEATGVSIVWERVEAGARALATHGALLPDDVLASLEYTRIGLKGPTATPIGGGHQSINVALRKKLGLYTNFRPVRRLPGLKTRYQDVTIDLAIFRENTEDLYSGLEHEVVPDVVESLKIITKTASMRIARATFEYARREQRRKVTAVHKANIMKMSDGLFLKCCREVAAAFPDVQYEELIVDNACMQLVMRPERFDLLVLPTVDGIAAMDPEVIIDTTGNATLNVSALKPGTVGVELSRKGKKTMATMTLNVVSSFSLGAVTPSNGTTAGGTLVAITGQNFEAPCSVKFGNVGAEVLSREVNVLRVKTPQHPPATTDVVVTCGGSTQTLPRAFTFLRPRGRTVRH